MADDVFAVDGMTWIELVGGGLHDGRRLRLAASETEMKMPATVVVTLAPAPDVTRPPDKYQRYRWDGTTKDGGVRVFRAVT